MSNHRPSLVLELPNSPKFVIASPMFDRQKLIVRSVSKYCKKPWPCPSMREDQ